MLYCWRVKDNIFVLLLFCCMITLNKKTKNWLLAVICQNPWKASHLFLPCQRWLISTSTTLARPNVWTGQKMTAHVLLVMRDGIIRFVTVCCSSPEKSVRFAFILLSCHVSALVSIIFIGWCASHSLVNSVSILQSFWQSSWFDD